MQIDRVERPREQDVCCSFPPHSSQFSLFGNWLSYPAKCQLNGPRETTGFPRVEVRFRHQDLAGLPSQRLLDRGTKRV